MRHACPELTLRSAMSDPLIRTVMAADDVDPAELESMLRRIAAEVAPRLRPSREADSREVNDGKCSAGVASAGKDACS